MTAAEFGAALRTARKAKKMTQESFEGVSSRAYLSLLERGLRSPTLKMIEALAEELKLHPLTLLALTYVQADPAQSDCLLELVASELEELAKKSSKTIGDKC